MADIIVIAILLAVVVSAIAYIRREKKRGAVCIGCPHAGTCAKKLQGGCDHSGTNQMNPIYKAIKRL